MKSYKVKSNIDQDLLSDSTRFESDKGEISLLNPCQATAGTYEIYCIEGGLFDNVERYATREIAFNRIKELLM